MKLLKKLLDIPIKYSIIFGIISTILIVLTVKGEITIPLTIAFIVLTLFATLQMHFGSIVLKSILSTIVILYSASIYTSAVMSLHGNIVEPFLLTVAAVTLFLAQTYDKKRIYYGIRSRALWSAVLAFLLVALKLSFILSQYSFMVTELIGANLLILFIAIWRLWLHISSKTVMIQPEVVRVEDGEYRKIVINTKLDMDNKFWLNGKLKKREKNAYAYIYNEVLLAKEAGLQVVFVYNGSSSKFYDVGEVKVSKKNKVKYLYVESKEEIVLDSAINELKD